MSAFTTSFNTDVFGREGLRGIPTASEEKRARSIFVWTRRPFSVCERRRAITLPEADVELSWSDGDSVLPAWFDPLVNQIANVLALGPNWDTYGAPRIEPKTVSSAVEIVFGILGQSSPAPQIVPLATGGIQFEWHRRGVDLEIVFDADSRPTFTFEDSTGTEETGVIPENLDRLRALIAKVE